VSERPAIPRPLPRPGHYTDTAPFWAAARQHRLLIQYCTDTGRPQWFPRSAGLTTGRRHVEWREASGQGTVYSWTVANRAWPGHEGRVPYICALVELDEGVRMLVNLLNTVPGTVRIGMPVKVCWERLADGIEFPAFEPA
jgi:uncharacterized protein